MNAPNSFKPAGAVLEGPVLLTRLPEASRFNLRIDTAHLDEAGRAFGLALPGKIGEGARDGTRRALCLGPDEWVLSAADADRDAIVSAFSKLYAEIPHSLVEVGDREIAVVVEGAQAATLLSVGCPIDVEDIAVGAGTRTIFDGAQVVLFRDGHERFTMEVWRSFLPHAWNLLATANREFAVGL